MTKTIDTTMLKDPDLLTKEEIEQLLPILDELNDWTAKVKDYALQQALNGESYNGYKVVEGKTMRKFEDEQGAVQAIVKAGYAETMCYERKVLSLSKLEALLGKKKFADVCGAYITKPQGKPALVPEDDPREPFKTSAAEDFADSEEWLK
jgi:hypothetical protein